MVSSPVLMLVFNRPLETQKTFDVIRSVKPARLYIAADGPRPGREDDLLNCEAVRQVALTVDWPCELTTLFREENLGCKKAVSGAISWFFENEEQGIIIEDDIIADPGFFRFCDELLELYKDNSGIMAISASNYVPKELLTNDSYYFSRYPHIWGWASWRRAWRLYDVEMSRWETLRESDWLLKVGDGNRDFERYWKKLFDRTSRGEINTWDYQWLYTCWSNNGLAILPRVNLSENIGFDQNATHTSGGVGWIGNLKAGEIHFPLIHPTMATRHQKADRWQDLNVLVTKPSIIQKTRYALNIVNAWIRKLVS